MVFGFIKQSHGYIGLQTQENAGTSFRLYFPRTFSMRSLDTVRPDRFSLGKNDKVLVVEDNPSLRRIVVRQMQELGYNAVSASTAAEALAILEMETIKILFTDIIMPGGQSGFDLVREVSEKWPDIQLIVTSGFPDVKLADDMDKFNRIKIISKPYRKEDLGRLLASTLEGV